MNKHTIISLILFTIISLNVSAQRWGLPNLRYYDNEPFHWGFLLGLNQMDFSVKQNFSSLDNSNNIQVFNGGNGGEERVLHSVLPSPSVGFTIGLVGSYRLANNLNLRFTPSLLFGDRNLIYSFAKITSTGTEPFKIDSTDDIISIKSNMPNTLIELPLILRYNGERIQNVRPFIEAGLQYAIKIKSDTWTNTIDVKHQTNGFKEMDKNLNLINSSTYGILGIGVDFYFDYFKMGIEGTMSYGLNNNDLIKSAPPTIFESGITSLKPQIFQISVTFE